MTDQTMKVVGERTKMSAGDITTIEIDVAHKNNHGMLSHATKKDYTISFVENRDEQFVLDNMTQRKPATPTNEVDLESLDVLRFATGYIMQYYDVPVDSPFVTDE